MSKLNVLFITHETSRSGAPLLLLNYIKWLSERDLVKPYILIGRRDEIDGEFSKLGKVFYSYKPKNSIGKNIVFKIYVRFFNSPIGKNLFKYFLKLKLGFCKIDIIYSNTICNGNDMNFLSFLRLNQICHVHEAEGVINIYGLENLNLVKENTSNFIACSKFVKDGLVKRFNISDNNIELIYSSVSKSILIDAEKKNTTLNLINKNTNTFLIGGSGGLGYRKGTDLIVPLMKEVLKFRNDICFVWVGGNKDSKDFTELQNDITINGLDNNIKIIGSVTNPIDYYTEFDVFTLLSREEPFGLVCLENALLEKPVLCFESIGGAPELLDNCKENIIPFLNLEKMANRIFYLMDNPYEANEIGKSLKKKVLENYTSEICFPMMYDIIQKFSKS